MIAVATAHRDRGDASLAGLEILRADASHVPIRLDDGNRAVRLAGMLDAGQSMLSDLAVLGPVEAFSADVE